MIQLLLRSLLTANCHIILEFSDPEHDKKSYAFSRPSNVALWLFHFTTHWTRVFFTLKALKIHPNAKYFTRINFFIA